ncbi:MAG: D-alanyl-D-alanine carboxypeptidase, partial [Micrococcales bacterium]|nr:D-alanyl-D-alanine carboxypeptidase [Micrococcales bacterium]
MRLWAIGAAAALVLVVGYGTADALDVAPGVLTLKPVPDPVSPFPTVVEAGPAVAALAGLDPDAPIPAASAVQAKIDTLVNHPATGPSVGVIVVDQLTGTVLGSHSERQGRQPASVAKILTGVAALTVMNPAATLDTTAVLVGGQVVLVGAGDIMLGDGAGDVAAVDGHAGLGDLAEQTATALRAAGVTTVSVGVDDTLFAGPTLAPGWEPDHLSMGYTANITALAVHMAKTDPTKMYSARYADPSLHAAQTFAARLGEQGITVTGTPVRATAPDGAEQLGVVSSAPVFEVVEYFLRTSDNTVTETVARLVAVDQGQPASFEGATTAVLAVIASLGIDTAGAHLADASGLASGSSVAATTFLGVVQMVTGPDHPEL